MLYKTILLFSLCFCFYINTNAQTGRTDSVGPALAFTKEVIKKSGKIVCRLEIGMISGADSLQILNSLKNINPEVPLINKAPVGKYTVVAQFIMDKNGVTSDVRALTNNGYGIEEEVIRHIKKAPRWVPTEQNEKSVKNYGKVTLTFEVIKKRKRENKG